MQVIAKSGVTINPLKGFVFTGNLVSDSYWEVDLPSADGIRIHGLAQSTITDTVMGEGLPLNYFGPCFVLLGENVAAGDELSITSSGTFRKVRMGDRVAGIALNAGTMGNTCTALLFQA